MADRAQVEQVVHASLEAFNRADWEAARRCMAPSYVYDEVGTGLHADGADAVLRAQQQWKRTMPDAAGELVALVVDGDAVACEVRWRGTHNGTLHTPMGDVPPSGRSYEEVAAMFLRVDEDGRLASCRHHIDALGLFTQLGVLPAPASA